MNLYALVDDEDFEFLSRYSWYLNKRSRNLYAQSIVNGVSIGMHQLICPSETLLITPDHKNGNGLDNRKENLRLATNKQQAQNARKALRTTSSKYKGVVYFKRDKCWRAYIKEAGKQIHLGYFKSELLAAKAYNRAAQEYFGEFARINVLEKVQ